MMVFEGVITALASVGIFELYLPFLLLFAIFFAILQKSRVFAIGKDTPNTKIDILLSFIISLYIVAFSPVAGIIGLWFANLFASVGVALISILVFFLVIVLMIAPWWDEALKSKSWKWLIPLGVIIAFLIVLGSTFGGVLAGAGGTVTIPGLSSQDILFLTLVIITILIIYWMTRPAKGTPSKWFMTPEI